MPTTPLSREAVSLGAAIRRLRETAKLRQRDLASRAKVDVTDLSRWENGRREPSLAQLRAIARALKVSLARLAQSYSPRSS